VDHLLPLYCFYISPYQNLDTSSLIKIIEKLEKDKQKLQLQVKKWKKKYYEEISSESTYSRSSSSHTYSRSSSQSEDSYDKKRQSSSNKKRKQYSDSSSPDERVVKSIKKKDPNMPQRPRTAWIFYSVETRKELKEKYPDMPHTEINKKLSKTWKNMSEDDKKPWVEKADQEKKDL